MLVSWVLVGLIGLKSLGEPCVQIIDILAVLFAQTFHGHLDGLLIHQQAHLALADERLPDGQQLVEVVGGVRDAGGDDAQRLEVVQDGALELRLRKYDVIMTLS